MEIRAIFLNKDPNDMANPLAYRILKIAYAVYRRWAFIRLNNLKTPVVGPTNFNRQGRGKYRDGDHSCLGGAMDLIVGQVIRAAEDAGRGGGAQREEGTSAAGGAGGGSREACGRCRRTTLHALLRLDQTGQALGFAEVG